MLFLLVDRVRKLQHRFRIENPEDSLQAELALALSRELMRLPRGKVRRHANVGTAVLDGDRSESN